MKSFFILIFYLYLNVSTSFSQITFTRAFTNKLADAGAKINLASDNWFNVTVCPDSHIRYDLCLESQRDSAEIRYIVFVENNKNRIYFPEVHFNTRVANIATNDDSYWIRTKSFSDKIIQDSLNADWAAELSFFPNKNMTDKRFAKAFALYKEDYGMIYAILFYNHEFTHFNEQLHSISFIKNY